MCDYPTNTPPLLYTPSFDATEIRKRLEHLLVAGEITDPDLHRRLAKLDERFRVYAATCPYGLWAPGLAPSSEMRRVAELYLPMAEIKCSFIRLFALAFRIPSVLPPYPFRDPTNWLDCLVMLGAEFRHANPGALLRSLAADEGLRLRFIFATFLPGRHGGGFGRYPEQTAFVRSWLKTNQPRFGSTMRCLDAACGTGEGTFELALLIAEEGILPECMEVHGSTLESVELFAAAHGYFPHDAEREKIYRRRIQPLIATGAARRLCFRQEDLGRSESGAVGGYDLVLCNGLLGGPTLHDQEKIAHVVRALAGRMRPGGVLLAADRFHDGWKNHVSRKLLVDIFAVSGLEPLTVGEGVAGKKLEKTHRER
jgi:chemotaxis methyl-accepting protein methylase